MRLFVIFMVLNLLACNNNEIGKLEEIFKKDPSSNESFIEESIEKESSSEESIEKESSNEESIEKESSSEESIEKESSNEESIEKESSSEDSSNGNSQLSETKYLLEEYVFSVQTHLNRSVEINAQRIVFPKGAFVKLKQYNLTLIADTIEFAPDVYIMGFDKYEYNIEHKKDRLYSGSLNFDARKIKGRPVIDLKGQNSGYYGLGYYTKKNKRTHHPDDKVHKGGRVPNFCSPIKKVSWNIVIKYCLRVSFNGETNGAVNIVYRDLINIKSFHPKILRNLSQGNSISTVHYKPKGSKKRYSILSKGLSENLGQYCLFDTQGLGMCFESYGELANMVRDLKKNNEINIP